MLYVFVDNLCYTVILRASSILLYFLKSNYFIVYTFIHMWTIQHELSTYFIYVKDYRLNIGKGNNISKLYEINRLASFFS